MWQLSLDRGKKDDDHFGREPEKLTDRILHFLRKEYLSSTKGSLRVKEGDSERNKSQELEMNKLEIHKPFSIGSEVKEPYCNDCHGDKLL
jgi:hypothetical protein